MAKPVATLTQGRSAQAQTSVNEDDVRRLAYELYERRGRQAGLEQDCEPHFFEFHFTHIGIVEATGVS